VQDADTELRHAAGILDRLIAVAEAFLRAGRVREAAVAAQVAAACASYQHAGVFVSPRLESLLTSIGRRTMPERAGGTVGAPRTIRRVLHVMTTAADVGGDTRFVTRLIQKDAAHVHSVAITSQRHGPVPPMLLDAVARKGGACNVLDYKDVLDETRELRTLARQADIVLLHIYPEDVVPTIAFAEKAGMPPVAFLAHADHQFWLGVEISDLVVHLRDSGAALSLARRGVDPARLSFLPIPLEAVENQAPRSTAREGLGIPQDAVVMLSIARGFKYDPVEDGPSFISTAEEVLAKHPGALMYVVGVANTGRWKAAHERTGGRLRAMGRRSDTRAFYEAADIYVDSFPFCSNTSLLEAASHGRAIVSYFPFSDDSAVLGPGAPGIDRAVLLTRSVEAYTDTLSRLIEDPARRAAEGERARNEMLRMHTGAGWEECLAEMYRRASGVTSPSLASIRPVRPAGELDRLLRRLYAGSTGVSGAIDLYTPHLPYAERLRVLRRMAAVDRSFSFSLFFPDRLAARLRGRARGWKQLLRIDRRVPTTG
jgi:hypothetical protein